MPREKNKDLLAGRMPTEEDLDIDVIPPGPGSRSSRSESSARVERVSRPEKRNTHSLYFSDETNDRLNRWMEFLGQPKYVLVERALDAYCDQLAERFNNGQDPVRTSIDTDELP